jgi:ADP-heptose:LPS heptosyltransferase
MKKNFFMHYSNLLFLQTKAAFILGHIINKFSGRAKQEVDLKNLKKALVLKTDGIGDFVLATAFLREFRLMFPHAKITLVVNPTIYNLAELCPYVDKFMIYRQSIPRFLRPFVLPWRALKLGYCALRPTNFDIVVTPRWDIDTDYTAYIAYFSFSKLRVGYTEHVYSRKQLFNKGFDAMLTDIIYDEKPMHEVERHLDFIRYLGEKPSSDLVELWISPEDDHFADHLLANLSTKMLIAFCPGAGKVNRQWPPDRFIELGQKLKNVFDASFIIIGGVNDIPVGKYIQKALGPEMIDYTGKTTLRQTVALLKRCHLYVGNDTGSMHLAAAMGVPVVEISCFPANGPSWHWNSPLRFGPWKVPHKILQPGRIFSEFSDMFTDEDLNHIREISVGQVQDAIHDLFLEISTNGK